MDGVEESALVWKTAPWCEGERPGVEEGALVWRRAPWCRGGRPGVEGAAWCGGERPDVDEDATGKERVAHMVRRKAPLRRERKQ